MKNFGDEEERRDLELTYMDIGEQISQIRKELGFTQTEFGTRLGYGPDTVSRWETGTRCPTTTLLARIAYLGCTAIRIAPTTPESLKETERNGRATHDQD